MIHTAAMKLINMVKSGFRRGKGQVWENARAKTGEPFRVDISAKRVHRLEEKRHPASNNPKQSHLHAASRGQARARTMTPG
jgi:hypothetical protein